MPSKEEITHPGIVESIDGNIIKVKILSQSACSTCNAKGMCSVAEMKEKIVSVNSIGSFTGREGDRVILKMKRSLGARAVWLGYVLPFLIVFVALIVLVYTTGSEGLAAVISLALLIPYYLILYLLKDRLSREFTFVIDGFDSEPGNS
jgi:sigma-E factor negative regulatory protein RseC